MKLVKDAALKVFPGQIVRNVKKRTGDTQALAVEVSFDFKHSWTEGVLY